MSGRLISKTGLLFLTILMVRCSDKGTPLQFTGNEPDVRVRYSVEVQPIFNANCVICHGPDFFNASLLLDTYEHVTAGASDHGPVVIPGNSAASLLGQKLQGMSAIGDSIMPPSGNPPLSSESIQAIIRWIDEGALNIE